MFKIIQRINQHKTELVVMIVLVVEFVFPHYTLAEISQENSIMLPNLVISSTGVQQGQAAMTKANETVSLISPTKDYEVVATYEVPVTAYSSTVDQTDSTPCITANGFNLCEHNQEDILAANFLPLGTKVRIPDYFGDRIFTVQDRMNARYHYRADIWMKDRTAALAWGLRYVKIEVIK